MPPTLPYLSAAGTVDTALDRIKKAAKPPKFTTDFVNTKLQIKGGTGTAIPSFMKKLGFVNADGTPTALYDRLRNEATAGYAVADAIRRGYKPLYEVNEYAHDLSAAELKGLILEVTGLERGSRAAELIFGTFKRLREHAAFDGTAPGDISEKEKAQREEAPPPGGLNLAYTINLNLPDSTNPDVFNAIFKSLKEHLLRD